jgi:hypothetical protein
MDITFKGMGRVPMEEIALYKVADGKIVSEQFFYEVAACSIIYSMNKGGE